MTEQEKWVLLAQLANVFSPSAPIDKQALFAGRHEQIRDVINAVFQRGQHVILFGERGVGKTSLANVLSEILTGVGLNVVSSGPINCDGTDNYASLWRKILREISMVIQTPRIGLSSQPQSETVPLLNLLPGEPVPDDIRYVLQQLGPNPAIITMDEIDRIKDRTTTTLLADTIKNLSDHSVNVTLILVGVGDSVDELISEHKSIERALVQVRMPRMSVDELSEIIEKGLNVAGMTIEPEASIYITHLSQGLPHYTHLLGLHASQTAIQDDRMNITMDDVDSAIRIAVDKAQQSILSDYHKAVTSPRENLYGKVLLACALAKTDDLGYFASSDVRAPMSRIMGKQYDIAAFSQHLNDFSEAMRGPILQKFGGPRRFRFRFVNPMMQPFVIMHGLARGIITQDYLKGS